MESSTNSKLQNLFIIFTLSSYIMIVAASTAVDDPSSTASTAVEDPTSSQSEKDEFLKAHNEVRARMNEPEFTWDPKLEEYARNYGAQRAEDCKLQHSEGPYGENLFWGSGAAWTPREAVVEWVKEDKNYDKEHNSCQSGQMCGHYTQIIWKSSTRLGCVRFLCRNGSIYAICEYDPPGNYIGEKPLDGITH